LFRSPYLVGKATQSLNNIAGRLVFWHFLCFCVSRKFW